MPDEKEKRKTIRINKKLSVLYSQDVDAEKKSWDETTINNLSETGMLITTSKNFQPNDKLAFLIKFPINPFRWVEFKGKVIESKGLKGSLGKNTAGTNITRIEFQDLKDEQKEMVRVYIAWFLYKKGGK